MPLRLGLALRHKVAKIVCHPPLAVREDESAGWSWGGQELGPDECMNGLDLDKLTYFGVFWVASKSILPQPASQSFLCPGR